MCGIGKGEGLLKNEYWCKVEKTYTSKLVTKDAMWDILKRAFVACAGASRYVRFILHFQENSREAGLTIYISSFNCNTGVLSNLFLSCSKRAVGQLKL